MKRVNNENGFSVLNFLCVYFILFFKFGFMFVETYTRYTSIFLLILAVIAFYKNRGVMFKSSFTVTVFYIICFLATYIVKGIPDTRVVIVTILNIITALLMASAINRREFFKYYTQIMYLICLFSIVGWLVMMVFHSTIIPLPELRNSAGRVGYYGIFTVISDFSNAGMQRCQGIFWEPGAFQALAMLALVLEKYVPELGNNKYHKYVYSIAILMSFSTTGYVALFIYWALELKNIKKALACIPIIGAVIFVFVSFDPGILGYVKFTLVTKFKAIFEYQIGITNVSSARVNSLLLPMQIFFSNPVNFIFGNGQKGAEEMYRMTGTYMATCTPINYLAKFGIPVCIVSFYSFGCLVNGIRENGFTKIGVFLLFLIAFASEAFDFSLLMNMLLLYGASYKWENMYENC